MDATPHQSTPLPITPPRKPAQSPGLVVFSDDWGRHPSSCQHLISQLLDRYPITWVNTIGTRAPRLSIEDLGKAAAKLIQWSRKPKPDPSQPSNLTVVNPRMYPGFRKRWQQRLNASLISNAVNRQLAQHHHPHPRIAVTTIPIVAGLIGKLQVDRWVYYCVDDFSVWPGLDGRVIDQMERDLVNRVDRVMVVSETLRQRIAQMGCESDLLTHGIDLDHWGFTQPPSAPNRAPTRLPGWWSELARPILLFWGVVDQRLDTPWCQALAKRCGSLVLLGPKQSPDPRLASTPRLFMPGPVPYTDLPALAAEADVLVMPYDDLPVTRAIQPLKFKEYLATGKPTVVRRLPATISWSDAADVVDCIDRLVEIVTQRAAHGTPPDQLQARKRLAEESWAAKAQRFEQALTT